MKVTALVTSRRIRFGDEGDYRAGLGASTVGTDAEGLATTGYFAHAASPTINASSASPSIVDFIELSSLFMTACVRR